MTERTAMGKPAGCISIVCPVCDGGAFRLLGPAPAGVKIGGRLPKGKHRITTAECCACGEHVTPWFATE